MGAPVDPPGTILQHLYLKERVSELAPGRFVDVGVGAGHLSDVLLSLGWSGTGYDLSGDALAQARHRTVGSIAQGRFELRQADWIADPAAALVDLVVSSMVLEHLEEETIDRYFAKARSVLADGGRAIVIVPGAPGSWGIEDVIAGHLRRYTARTLRSAVASRGWRIVHLTGLAYPLSNVLLGASNALVRRSEQDKEALTLQQRTEQSGARLVPWKTNFPAWSRVVLNESSLLPFHWLQKRCGTARGRALVLYCECVPAISAPPDARGV
jgi:SAM-dependent methyltransferase